MCKYCDDVIKIGPSTPPANRRWCEFEMLPLCKECHTTLGIRPNGGCSEEVDPDDLAKDYEWWEPQLGLIHCAYCRKVFYEGDEYEILASCQILYNWKVG